MSMSRSGPGGGRSGLPYQILAGVEPVPGGWLVAPGNLQGINLAPQPASVMPTLADVLDYRPSFTVSPCTPRSGSWRIRASSGSAT